MRMVAISEDCLSVICRSLQTHAAQMRDVEKASSKEDVKSMAQAEHAEALMTFRRVSGALPVLDNELEVSNLIARMREFLTEHAHDDYCSALDIEDRDVPEIECECGLRDLLKHVDKLLDTSEFKKGGQP